MDPQLRQQALEYHESGSPGKISVTPTKQLVNQRDLALAYSPGVAAACEEIVKDPANAFRYTSRGNLVAVITNGTAVLGLGNIGPLAAKPVMEGKGVLFKKFAGIDVFDLEVNENNLDRLVDIVAALEPTFGGVNLEDIKAPDCFYVERKLRERMKIPVFHDDQHGTAIVVGAALVNGLTVVGKDIKKVKLVVSGAGAAALACLDLLLDLGLPKENIWVTDLAGVVYEGRKELMDPEKDRFVQKTNARTLADVIEGADVFLGLSAAGVLKKEMVAKMAAKPLIFALANPDPEILPEDVKAVRDDAIVATGRTDYPNQVNNVLCFPFIFRGALDSGATTITRAMELAAVHAVAELARAEQSEVVSAAYGSGSLSFGPDYLIPKPFDPRLIVKIAPAVAKAAAESGVATRPIADLDAYVDRLQEFVYHSGNFMKPIFAAAKRATKNRIVYAEGEEERVLRAVQVVVDEELARPILVGRPSVLESRIERFGLRIRAGVDFDLVNPESDRRYRQYWETYHAMTERKGVTEQYAKLEMRRRHTLIGAMMMHLGEADGMICGTFGSHSLHLHYVDQVLGRRPDVSCYAAMNLLILPKRSVAIVDTHVNADPSAEELAEITLMAAEEMRRIGITPRIALLSHSNFGSSAAASAEKMRQVLELVRARAPGINIDGEMHGDIALDAELRRHIMPRSTLVGEANLLVCPSIDAANISYNLLKIAAGNGIAIGPVLLGCKAAAAILTSSATVRRIVNMTALTVLDANARA
ncbi:MAG: NADP-dependent malic enzyme [Betaproteobacteria bacterium]|jgi:malate dehydrogenase (oxaloacetate-decarboxylating)(NADP+)|nr:NADP-dependent malic enzyme [Betaproteobacteria bacterium]